ncbi:dual specificity protein phosphatase [Leptolyngbya sp. NIES-3755]|nr:dual specificity protein phosphatase [Leptolyngbya sp. NIES-3755]
MYKFAAACEGESIVFGSARPEYENVSDWIEFMKAQGIQRVCCLLPESQLNRYNDLIGAYEREFNAVCWSPIEDFRLSDRTNLTEKILPFLAEADQKNEKVVVHCSGGIGRTGHVLAAWLVYGRGMLPKDAIASVKKTGKNPHEAAIAALFFGRNPFKVLRDLNALLDSVR